jgi:HNH endonuclease
MTDLYLIAHTALAVSLERRLLEKTIKLENGCWYCSAGGKEHRYGTIWFNNQSIGNHVASYLVHRGPIPHGILVCHTCDYSRCINPAHLFLGTHKDNMADMMNKGRNALRSGELNGRAKFTPDEILKIREMLDSGHTQQEVADAFSTSQGYISELHLRKRWDHV